MTVNTESLEQIYHKLPVAILNAEHTKLNERIADLTTQRDSLIKVLGERVVDVASKEN